jgi:subtilase family serine protease
MAKNNLRDLQRLTTIAALSLAAATAQAQVAGGSSNAAPDLTVHRGDSMEGGQIVIPPSSQWSKADAGQRAHTHIQVFVPSRGAQAEPGTSGSGALPNAYPASPQPVAGMFAETPASLACVYGQVAPTTGCNANILTTNASGGSRAVAVVDAYDNPTALTDLQAYSTHFGLPTPNLTIVYATGVNPGLDPATGTAAFGWEIEAALDVDMVHAMAPGAHIYLVEAAGTTDAQLLAAEDVATTLVRNAGGGEVSNSWGGPEFSGQTSYDSHFAGANVVYFASTGDDPGVEWPSTSANVVAAGGTSLSRNLDATYSYRLDTSWILGGGGPSVYVPTPSYQKVLQNAGRIAGFRTVPDIAFDANPYTGVWVSCSQSCGNAAGVWWYIVGGTSVASPALAGITNSAGSFLASSAAELTRLYSNLGNGNINDIQYGTCGPRVSYLARLAVPSDPALQYDACTGLGTPNGRGAF